MAAQQNEAAWLDYYHSGVLGQKLTNREVILARRAFLAGRESAQQSVHLTSAHVAAHISGSIMSKWVGKFVINAALATNASRWAA